MSCFHVFHAIARWRVAYVRVPFMVLPVITQNWPSIPEGNTIQRLTYMCHVEEALVTPRASTNHSYTARLQASTQILTQAATATGQLQPQARPGQPRAHLSRSCSRTIAVQRHLLLLAERGTI